MTHNIIKTENYLLVVDDSEIKAGKTLLSKEGIIHTNIGWNYGDKVIIAHLPLNNSPVLEFVPLLPPLEDEVLELVQAYVINTPDNEPLRVYAFIEGYNKAKEKYKYTEGDLTRAFNIGINSQFESTELKLNKDESFDRHSKNLLKLIQSLQQPKMPVGFECEVERIYPNPQTISKEYDFDDILIERKTTTNSQGQTVLVGKYIY